MRGAVSPGRWVLDGAQVCIERGCALANVHGTDETAKANGRLLAEAKELYLLLEEMLPENPTGIPTFEESLASFKRWRAVKARVDAEVRP